MDLLEVENLTFTYPLCASPAVRDVSFRMEEGSFAVLCGATGSGKSTLLRLLKRELGPLGEKSGRVLRCGEEIDGTEAETSARSVGFVMQNPEQQIVTDKVWHELAFTLENLGEKQSVILSGNGDPGPQFGQKTDQFFFGIAGTDSGLFRNRAGQLF